VGVSDEDGDWVDDYGTGMSRPDLEALYERRDNLTADEAHAVFWWAWALEGRVHQLQMAAGDGEAWLSRFRKLWRAYSARVRADAVLAQRVEALEAEVERLRAGNG
jgi:cell division protein FtsB